VAALAEVRRREDMTRSASDCVADAVTRFAGSMWCVYVHGVWFGAWIIINAGWVRGIKPFDPFPFVMLAMIASVEAIFCRRSFSSRRTGCRGRRIAARSWICRSAF
jgi:uncharacterized membrane protein